MEGDGKRSFGFRVSGLESKRNGSCSTRGSSASSTRGPMNGWSSRLHYRQTSRAGFTQNRQRTPPHPGLLPPAAQARFDSVPGRRSATPSQPSLHQRVRTPDVPWIPIRFSLDTTWEPTIIPPRLSLPKGNNDCRGAAPPRGSPRPLAAAGPKANSYHPTYESSRGGALCRVHRHSHKRGDGAHKPRDVQGSVTIRR